MGKFTDHPELYAWVLALIGLAGIIAMVISSKTIPPELWTLEGITVGGALGVTAPLGSSSIPTQPAPATPSPTGQVAESGSSGPSVTA